MFADPLAITYNSVSKDLVRVNQDNFGADYYLDDGEQKFTVEIRHTLPKNGKAESHLMKVVVDHFDTEGTYIRSEKAWSSFRTDDKPQVSADAALSWNALSGILTSGNVAKLLARES